MLGRRSNGQRDIQVSDRPYRELEVALHPCRKARSRNSDGIGARLKARRVVQPPLVGGHVTDFVSCGVSDRHARRRDDGPGSI